MTTPASSPSQSLPDKPSLALLGNLAKQLRKAHAAGDASAIVRLRAHHPKFASWPENKIRKTPLALRDAQTVIAREYGFETWAAMKQHVLSLLDADAQKQAIASLMDAVNRGDVKQTGEILDKHPDIIDSRGGSGNRTALHFAAWKGNQPLVELLLDRGADPTIRDVGDNATPLHFAAENGSLAIVKLLVEHGGDIDGFGDVHNWDVIGWATLSKHTHLEVAQYLLSHGAQHNIFSAVAMGDVDAIRRLAAVSRDVPDKPMAAWERRRRPLHLAVVKRQPNVIPVLLEIGADIEATDIYKLTALDEAALRGEKECADQLLARGAKIHLPAAFGLRRQDVIDRALAVDPNILKPEERWENLIVLASEHANGQVIEHLVACGASIDIRMDSKWSEIKASTPLHDAAWNGNLDAIKTLVRLGAPLEAEDGTYHGTPAGWAKYNGQTEAYQLLVSLGAKT